MTPEKRKEIVDTLTRLTLGPSMFHGAVDSHFKLTPGEAAIAAAIHLAIAARLAGVGIDEAINVVRTVDRVLADATVKATTVDEYVDLLTRSTR